MVAFLFSGAPERPSSANLLDIMQKYNWQIVDRNFIEVVPNERENAWKDLLILALRVTPLSFRKNLRAASLRHFDYRQPILYDLKNKRLGISTQSVIDALSPPSQSRTLVRPFVVITSFIAIVISYLVVEGMVV
ncbi:PIF-6 [Plodia interpunctella granulovirus]|uniref:PIF-6 n=1 Tax=Plodia interpunctella granulovirus TaxID=262175 RepID=A0A1L5JGQ6_9BBAC|nr:PIF-6 [Plodia interpunctella granulovirus]APO13983.1 PIF-6 [Plodia interpunctella granulovirus]